MFLSDRDIEEAVKEGHLVIDPFDRERLQPASYDLTLDNEFLTITSGQGAIDMKREVGMRRTTLMPGEIFQLPSLGFALASTREQVHLDSSMIGRLEGKSSLGRLGLTAHVTAGFFDPGFEGYPTLELFNATPYPMWLYPGMPICQMSFAFLFNKSTAPYGSDKFGSKYQGQTRGPKSSQYFKNFKENHASSKSGMSDA